MNLVLLTKLQAPEIKTKTLRRDRLLNLLSENLDKKVILLCAGAGYGKTTLLSQFLSDKKLTNVYYHLEKSDAEPAVFLSYLIAGIRKIKPEFGKKIERLRHFFNYPQKYLEIIIGTFINEIIENISQDLFIILEDYHFLDPPKMIDEILIYLLNHLPPHLHIIITSRKTPSISLSQLRTRDELFELNNQHLKFTKDEIKSLFETVYSVPLKEDEIEWIEGHSEGWPTSLRLILQSSTYLEGIKSSDSVREILDSYYRSQSNFFKYFAQEIYNQESKQTRQFLVDCSILEWLTPGLCDAVTGRKDSVNILSDLTSRNAFLLRIPGMGYRFHNLFRDFLCSKLSDIDKEKRIYRRAGDFYFKNGRLEQAIKFYLQTGNYTRAISIIEKIGSNLIEQGKSAILCSYIEKVPNSMRNKSFELLMHYGQSLIHIGRPDEAKSSYLKAAKSLKKRVKNRIRYADALYELGGISLNEDKLGKAKDWFNQALRVCPKSTNINRAKILNSLGFVYTNIGGKNRGEATGLFEKALQIARKSKCKELEASILNNWAANEWKIGNLNQAYSRLLMMVNLLKTNFSPHCGLGFYNASRLSLLLGYKKEAQAILDSGIKTCSAYNDLWSMAALYKGYALLHQELGDIQKAQQDIARSLEIHEKLAIIRLITTTLNEMCRINIAAGDFTKAQKNLFAIWWFKKNREDADAVPMLLTEAQLRVAQGKFDKAEDILLNTLKLTQKFRQKFNSFLVHIELSKVLHLQRKGKEVLPALKQAVNISRDKGYDYLLLKELQKEKWMLQILMRENIEKKYIVSAIKRTKLDIHWVDVFLFGIPKIFIDGNEIRDKIWKTTKAKKLLFYLLLQKDKKTSHDMLIEALWQSGSYKSGRDSLRKAIQHIRQALDSGAVKQSDLIVSSKDFYQVSPHASIQLDTDEFENLITQAKNLKNHDEALRSTVQRVISIYKHGFAVGWYDGWVEELRHYYKGLYEDCLGSMANLCFRKKRFKQAITWFEKLLSLNSYDEEYHRKLMIAYSELGKYDEIAKDFETLKKILKKELNTVPQQETVNLYKSLIR